MSNLSQNVSGEFGNTKTNSHEKKHRKWCFTLNNYTEKEEIDLINYFVSKVSTYLIGQEVGEQGTPHLQGYVEFKNQVRFSTLKNVNERIHWNVCKGNREQNIKYCSKDGKYKTNFDMSKYIDKKKYVLDKQFNNVVWKEWQQNIINMLEQEPDNRQINWYWEESGNVGKSFICKYIGLKYKNVIISEGKKDNVYNQVLNLYNSEEYDPTKPIICILDISRHSADYINYGCIESIKNGMVYSGKYEGGQCYFITPHIFIFSNTEPDDSKWSEDRYRVVELNE